MHVAQVLMTTSNHDRDNKLGKCVSVAPITEDCGNGDKRIRVVVRARPALKKEPDHIVERSLSLAGCNVTVAGAGTQQRRQYEFDAVLGSSSSQVRACLYCEGTTVHGQCKQAVA
jgi:hypothetical protein